MNNIAVYIMNKYGYDLNRDELDIVIQWYKDNENSIKDEKDLDLKIRDFLIEKFPDKLSIVMEEDTSNMNYLLNLLKSTKNS